MNRFSVLASLVFAAGLALAPAPLLAQAQRGDRHTDPSGVEQLKTDTETYRQHVTTLANPFFEGRAPGTRGNRLAADYIEFHLRRLGLSPAFTDPGTDAKTYRQPFSPPGARPPYGKVELITQRVNFGERELTPDVDFKVLGYSGSGDVGAPLAFVGYSILAGQNGYGSYPEGTDLAGKVAMVLRFEPMNDQGTSRWAETRWSSAAALDAKLRAAVEVGAGAIILVNPPGAADERVGRLEGLELSGNRPLKVPVIMMTTDAANELVKASDPSGRSLMDLRKLADESGGVIELGQSPVTVSVDLRKPSTDTDNVGGVLPGVGALANEWVIIGSHYDHVGYGPVGAQPNNFGQIHAGADDNASGSAGNLLTAERLAAAYAAMPADQPRRSVLFLWFSAEESGLEGARYFTQHPTMPLENVSIMLNMDMIGRLRETPGLEVGGIASAEGLEEWLKPYWDSAGMVIKPTRFGAPNSDHFAFQTKQVPNLFVFTGLHREYHTPADVVSTVNMEGGAQVADLVGRIALDVALRPEKFVFATGGFGSGDDEQPQRPANPQQAGGIGALKVRFGIMPGDYAGDDGVLIGDLSNPEWPAGKAGLKAGDLMTSWNGEPLKGVAQWMQIMMKNNPGDKVKITYTREVNGEKQQLETEAELIAAPSRNRQ